MKKNIYYLYLIFGFLLINIFPVAAQYNSWSEVITPNPSSNQNILRGISGISENEMWTVGHFRTSPTAQQFISENLIMKWDGNAWTTYPVFNPGLTLHDLYDVEFISSNDIWAVGEYAYGAAAKPQLLHFDGNAWSHVSIPNVPNAAKLYDIHAISANDIWAVGTRSGVPASLAYALHYDGTSWTEVPVPPVGGSLNYFYAIDGISSNDVWAVGRYDSTGWGNMRYLAMHWDGNSWTNSQLPPKFDTLLGNFEDVVMIAPNDVWAIGEIVTGGRIILHWDGNAWSEKTPPDHGLTLAAVGPNDIYAIGNKIRYWTGSSWIVVDSLPGITYGSLGNATVLPDGNIWAAGRSGDAAGNFYNLVYRTDSSNNPGTVGIEEIFHPDITITPNPTSDYVYITITLEKEGEGIITLYNSTGQEIRSITREKFRPGKNSYELSFGDLMDGIYFVKLSIDEKIVVKKILKI